MTDAAQEDALALDRLAVLSLQERDEGHRAQQPVDAWDADGDDWDAAGEVPQFSPASKAVAAAATSSGTAAAAAHPRDARSEAAHSSRDDDMSAGARSPTPLREIAFEGGHVLEFYSLNEITTSTDLEAWLQKVDRGRLPALVRWVDEEHALALFFDPESAQHALQQPCKYQKRPFAKASLGARSMPSKQLAPPAPRPKTNAAVASRLIGSALGVRGVRDKAGEAALAAQRKQNAEQRRLRQAQQGVAWDE